MKPNNDEQKNQYLNVQEVAKMLNVSPKTIYFWHKKNYLPSLKLGSRVLFDKSELMLRIYELKMKSRVKQD